MYIPKSFENNNITELHSFIEKYNFATLISQQKDELLISHVPVMLDRSEGPFGTLIFHLAKLNPQALMLDNASNTACVFQGPHAYISPSWYSSSPSVPTWNYTAVHTHGTPRSVDSTQLSYDLKTMVNLHESQLKENAQYTIPDDYQKKLMEHIIGFHMKIIRIEGKFKLGQNRSAEDQRGLLSGLKAQKNTESQVLAAFIQAIHKDNK